MKDQNEILVTLKQLFEEMFEIDPAQVELDTSFRELDIDSIDAVDLMVRLHEIIGRRIRPEDFKGIQTVGDVVAVIHRMQRP
ncbi:MAG: acyl carrier protein [Methylohalobius sp. ZOD2]|uniref:acyl carrier protein n=1 Tax=Methylohalobius crimeensis TaxID=244365 RepID=UPI0003B60A8B|nr:acyl carrier protein [Methylohalobius crimeensis]MBN2702134.1 acyl carrier protein [Methylothermaceae bacterium]